MSKSKLARNIGSMSIAVFISRIFGLVRDIIMTNFFGTSYVADAFRVAFQIPNFLRRLFGEGALSAALVPIYTEIGVKDGKKAQINFALNVLSILTIFLLILCLIGIALAPVIVRILAPGFDVITRELVIKLTRILFPYLFLIGLSSTLISILNSHDYFFIPGLSSAFLNIAMIGSLGIFVLLTDSTTMESKIVIWSFGVLIGGVLQTIVNLPLLKKIGYTIRLNLSLKSEALLSVWKRLIPGAIGIAVRQINLVADMILASLLVTGSIAALGYGNRLMQLPMGIFGVATGVAVLPMFSRYVAEKNWKKLQDSLRFSVITLSYIMLPITAIIAGLGKGFIKILFMRGQFDITSVDMTYRALLFYSLGIIFYSLNRLIIPVFYANKDTKTPVKVSALIVFINIILNIILMQFLQHAGLAFATSISAMIQFIILIHLLRTKIPKIQFPKVWGTIIKITFLSILIFIGLTFLNRFYDDVTFWETVLKTILLSLVSMLFFIFGAQVLKIEYSAEIRKIICRKFLKK
ncbi:MAG: murein biosynthesis integral membrane protein MurJ [Candidatus Cloacimonetes bacterium]|nr:murein biosynthesis integral membrane protein MurJ [Candidatus Cloacimonadota bacterium]